MSFFKKKQSVIVSCGEKEFPAEIADNFFSKATGLMFRSPHKHQAMFFKESGTRPIIWNLGMRFPISIVWLSADKVVGVSRLPRFFIFPQIAVAPPRCNSFLEIEEGIFSYEELKHVRITHE